MEYEGKEWRLVDDPVCDLEDWESIPVDCTECDCFYDCFEEDT